MAIITNLPPQAYTRDTLVKAIEWLSHQPSTVRERANSADLIVSYYLQACRRAAAQMEAPVSGETFKSDLKHLAEDLKQFEDPFAPPNPPSRSSLHISYADYEPEIPLFRPEPPTPPVIAAVPHSPPPPRMEPPSAPKVPTWPMDGRSLAAAREIQQRFNLSTQGEALRMLVQLGADRLKELFPSKS